MLSKALDRIHGWGAPSEPADTVAASLDADDVRAAASIHVAVLLENTTASAVRLITSENSSAAVYYEDLAIGFEVLGVDVSLRDGPHELSNLLWLLQFSRDGSDALVYLTPEMREERIRDLAQSSGASSRFVRFLVAHYHNLSKGMSI